MCLIMTLVTKENHLSITSRLLLGWNDHNSLVENYDHADLSRIWILFNDQVRLSVYSSSKQAVDYHVYSKFLERDFFFTEVYASSNDIQRRELWQDLCSIKSSMLSVPWVAVVQP